MRRPVGQLLIWGAKDGSQMLMNLCNAVGEAVDAWKYMQEIEALKPIEVKVVWIDGVRVGKIELPPAGKCPEVKP